MLFWLFSNRAFRGGRTVRMSILQGHVLGGHFRAVRSPRSWMSSDLEVLQDLSCLAEGKKHLLFCRSYLWISQGKDLSDNTTDSHNSQYALCTCYVLGSELSEFLFLHSLFIPMETLLDGCYFGHCKSSRIHILHQPLW